MNDYARYNERGTHHSKELSSDDLTLAELRRIAESETYAANVLAHDQLALIDRVQELEARLARVKALHAPVDVEPSDTICGECSYRLPNGRYFGKVEEYPCPTIRAADEYDTSEAAAGREAVQDG